MLRYLLFSVFFLGGPLFFCALQAQSVSCDKGQVTMKSSKYEILNKCGEPTAKDHCRVSRIRETSEEETVEFLTVENWLYNFGPERFVVVLTFENDQLTGVKEFGYGMPKPEVPDFQKSVAIGDPPARLLYLYGPPSDKEERQETAVVTKKKKDKEKEQPLIQQKTVATWTYNLGPERFMRIYHFVDNKLTGIKDGPKGFVK